MTDSVTMFREEATGEVCPTCGEVLRVKYVPVFRGEMAIPVLCDCGRRKAAEERERDTVRGYRLMRDEARRIAGIGARYRGKSLSALTPREGQESADAALTDFMHRWREDRHTDGVMLLGEAGCGKTLFASAAANTVIDEYPIDAGTARECGKRGTVTDFRRIIPVRLYTVPDLMAALRAEIGADGGDPLRIENAASRAPLLILDDLGAEKMSEYGAEVLFRIIDRREREMLPVIVTSNLRTPEVMQRHLGERIFSRLQGMCVVCPFTCGDQRGRHDERVNTADRSVGADK